LGEGLGERARSVKGKKRQKEDMQCSSVPLPTLSQRERAWSDLPVEISEDGDLAADSWHSARRLLQMPSVI
jgi:hypothetical protein